MAAVDDANARCGDHPYGPNPGGICALCLQEKLGKLVSSSNFAAAFLPVPLSSGAASSSLSPSLPSPTTAQQQAADSSSSASRAKNKEPGASRQRHSRFPFLVYAAHGHIRKRSNKKGGTTTKPAVWSSTGSSHAAAAGVASADPAGFVLKRSKSVAPRPAEECAGAAPPGVDLVDSPRKRRFWSFLYLSFHSQPHHHNHSASAPCNNGADLGADQLTRKHHGDMELSSKQQQQDAAPSGHKVSRSRSVGCGSRSFSSDFLERISTGLVGDCTLRRVESQREQADPCKQQPSKDSSNVVVLRRLSSSGAAAVDPERPQQRVRWCGGIFGGLGIVSSSLSSAFWFPEELCGGGAARAQVDTDSGGGGNTAAATLGTPRGGRGKSWGWSFAGPIRAFRPSSKPCSGAAAEDHRDTGAIPVEQSANKNASNRDG